jgi:hypothetical protein
MSQPEIKMSKSLSWEQRFEDEADAQVALADAIRKYRALGWTVSGRVTMPYNNWSSPAYFFAYLYGSKPID